MWKNKIYNNSVRLLGALAVVAVFVSCGSKRNLTTDGGKTDGVTTATPSAGKNNEADALRKACLNKVGKNKIGASNLVANMDFRLQSGSKDITVGGKLSMRYNEVIRIQLVPLGLAEIGRLEFSKDSVLFMDRLHKQYVRGSYNDVSFLKDNGIDFYSLQALFWNQLYVVGGKSLDAVDVTKSSDSIWKLQYSQGKMDYSWWAETVSGLIRESVVAYRSSNHGTSQFKWNYDNYQAYEKGKFPASHTVKFKGGKKDITVTLTLSSMKNDTKWDAQTNVSSKYKVVSIEKVLGLLTGI